MYLSIIIPVLNESGRIGPLLDYLCRQTADDPECEIFVVDGGSTDGTLDKVGRYNNVTLISSSPGRARQMNTGAHEAHGDTLYFLHSDTYPPQNFVPSIRRAVEEGATAGCFRLSFDWDHPLLQVYSWFTRFDIDIFRFGDQSLFVRKDAFEQAGCFDGHLVVMEDNEIIGRLRRQGPFRLLDRDVVTSARKYQMVGPLKLQWWFTVIFVLYHIGFSQKYLVKIYRSRIANHTG